MVTRSSDQTFTGLVMASFLTGRRLLKRHDGNSVVTFQMCKCVAWERHVCINLKTC